MKIQRNSAHCLKCDDHIESESRHDFKWCSCRSVAVDGGKFELRRLFTNLKDFKDTSIYTLDEPLVEPTTPYVLPDMIPF